MNDTARNGEYIRRQNRRHILQLLRRKPMSRIELAGETGLTRAAITLITRELIEEGFLTEGAVCSRSGKGKSPIPLAVVPQSRYALGVLLNRAGCLVGIADFAGNVLEQYSIPVTAADPLDEIIAAMRKLAGMVPEARLIGAGICAPGPLDAENGVILNPPCFDQWHNTTLVSRLSAALEMPVYLEKDACVLALYHLETGESRDFLLLLVDDGIGSGVVSEGHLLVSRGHYTCELGHTTIVYNGKPCGCGNRGCLEAYGSIPNLLADDGGRYTSWRDAVDAGDTALLDREAEYLSAGIVNIRNMVNIDTVYLAGDIRYGFDLLSPRLTERVCRHSLRKTPVRILPSYPAAEIGVAAAANLVFAKWLDLLE